MSALKAKIRADQQIGGSMEDSEREGPIGMMTDIASGIVDLFTQTQIDERFKEVKNALFPDLIGKQLLGHENGKILNFASKGELSFNKSTQAKNPAEEEAKAKQQLATRNRQLTISMFREAAALYREHKAKKSMDDTIRLVQGMNTQQLAEQGGYQAKYEHSDSVYNRVWVALKLMAAKKSQQAAPPVSIANSRQSKMAGMMNANGKGEKYSVTSSAAGMAG